MLKTRAIVAVLIVACLGASAGAGELAVAGKLAVDIHAELLVATDAAGHAVNWYNCGSVWGTFGDFGFDGPASGYPTLGKVAGSQAVIFDGGDRLRFDMPTPASITSDGDFSIEVWLQNPAVAAGECIVSWKGGFERAMAFDLTCGAAGRKTPADRKWHHVVVTQGDGKRNVHVDGKRVVVAWQVYKMPPGGKFVIGCDSAGKNHFTGAIAALRVHEGVMSDAQIAQNFKGGVALGTVLLPNIVDKPRGILFADNSKDPNIACRTSKHFRTCWEKDKDVGGKVAARIDKQLADAERYYEFYVRRLGMHLPIVSDMIKNRGDGRKYLIEICNNWGGGNFGGHMPHGFGYPIQGPGFISGHELAHAIQMHSMGSFPGNWWEAHANWMPERAGHPHVHPVLNNLTSMFFMGNGRHYYHCWLIFQHLAETPEYGPLFMAKMWHHCKRGEYLWEVARRIDPDPSTPMADEFVKMARRNVTWDYEKHDVYKTANDHADMNRLGRTLLEPIELEKGWLRVPRALAPQQFGYNICPLKATARTVTVDLQGYVNPKRGSDWRACMVAVDARGKPRYGTIWSGGKNTFAVKPSDKELHLVVAATPTKFLNIDMTKAPYRSDEQHQFPYKVRMTGATPLDVLAPAKPTVVGRAHANGGGFVARTATVEATAYVGPKAQVLDSAKVLGHARIEGLAVVRGKATVRDNAIVSGHALVEGQAVVRDYAKVRDFARISGSNTVRDSGKVIEHAFMSRRGKTVSGYAVAKGVAMVAGNVGGSAMVDGSYAKTNDLTRGVWFTWNWGAGKNPGELDRELGGLYVEYRFDKAHPYLAWDTYGVTHGLLVGGPRLVDTGRFELARPDSLALNGKDQYVEMPRDVADMRDITIDIELSWTGGARDQRVFEFSGSRNRAMYLTPSGTDGKLRFVIQVGSKRQVLAGGALTKGLQTRVQVMLSQNTGRLLVDGKLVDRNDKMTLNPDDVRATLCLLGRGRAGAHFHGLIGRVSIYTHSLIDEVPPSPDPAAWAWKPMMVSESAVVMRSAAGTDPRGGVEYFFAETTGKGGGDDSGWQKAPTYRDTGLTPGETYAYRVKMRDAGGNETKPSRPVTVKWANPKAFVQAAGADGLLVFEAEHYHSRTAAPDGHQWRPNARKAGFSGAGTMESFPVTGANRMTDYASQSPRLDYFVNFTKTGQHWLWVRSFAPGYNADSIHVALDLAPEPWGLSLSTGWGAYKWVRTKPFQVKKTGPRRLSVWMREDGTMLDKFVVTSSADYKPSNKLDAFKVPIGPGPAESPRKAGRR